MAVSADVTIIIAIYGDLDAWRARSLCASLSAINQTLPAVVVVSEAHTLATARNQAAAEADTAWLIFLDADDELDRRYVEAMMGGTGDLRQPSTLGITGRAEDDTPVLLAPHPAGLLVGNHIVIGAMVRRELFDEVGGFRELAAAEDWDLWIRCWLAGAEITTCPDAIYRVHVHPGSRNVASADTMDAYRQIHRAYQGRTPSGPRPNPSRGLQGGRGYA